jgi:hypothetical protein
MTYAFLINPARKRIHLPNYVGERCNTDQAEEKKHSNKTLEQLQAEGYRVCKHCLKRRELRDRVAGRTALVSSARARKAAEDEAQ